MRKRTILVVVTTVAAVAMVGGSLGTRRSGSKVSAPSAAAAPFPGGTPAAPAAAPRAGATIDETIAALQAHLAAVPKDYPGWASLGLAYVQQAKITINSDFYPKAEGALAQSLAIDDTDNFLAYAGLSALASARHDFATAEVQARKGLAVNPYSPVLYGALGDALVQLGRYDEADAAIDKMVGIRPDTPSLARQSYLRELRGDMAGARTLMQQALDFAPTPSDRAFALFYLGELDFNSGDPNAALTHYRLALAASPTDVQALAGKAKAEAALGQHLTAIDDYTTVVARAPEPGVVLEFGELLQSIGRTAEAQAQYRIVEATQQLFEANGVEPDATPTLFYADHGQPASALANAGKGITTRPFLVMQDAYAWALHVNGRDAEALAAERTAGQLGYRSALFLFHAGMIEHALGDDAGASRDLAEALRLNPYFSPLGAPVARQTLASLAVVA